MKEYSLIYARVAFPKKHKLEWLNYCALTNILPKDLQFEIKSLSDRINREFKDDIIIPMDNRINPGCVTTPESCDKISKEIFDGMNNIFKKLTGDDNVIRLVYGVDEMDEKWINKMTTAHEIGNCKLTVTIGHFLDYGPGGKSSGKVDNTPGIFKIDVKTSSTYSDYLLGKKHRLI